MKTLFIVAFVANIILNIVSIVILPERVAIHYGEAGIPNGWAPNWVNALIMFGTDVLLFVSIWFAPYLTMKTPSKWLNLPHKDYWMKEENKPRMLAILTSLMHEIGAALLLFMFAIGLLSILANLADPMRLNMPAFWVVFWILMIYTVYWCVKLYVRFRVPSPPTTSSGECFPS